MVPKRPHSPVPQPSSTSQSPLNPPIFKSTPIKDRGSTFIAVFSPAAPNPLPNNPSQSTKSNNTPPSATHLQSLPEFASATHRIAAWRLPSTQRTLSTTLTPTNPPNTPSPSKLHTTGSDDDGERHAGPPLTRLLQSRNVSGALVVARWFGGTMLGPVRFDHIRHCAGEAITAYELSLLDEWERGKREERVGVEGVGGGKRVRVGEGERGDGGDGGDGDMGEKERLIRELPERDRSIAVLRGLLAEKKGEVGGSQSGSQGEDRGKVVRYEEMGVVELRRMEKVRDATIGWILGQIEKVEMEMAKGGGIEERKGEKEEKAEEVKGDG